MSDTPELKGLRARLKTGEYDGVDIMKAWIAIEELMHLKESYQADMEKQRFKDHEVAIFVNELRNVAQVFGQTQQLRDRLSRCVAGFLSTKIPETGK